MGLEKEELLGSGLSFLTDCRAGKASCAGRKVLVIGGGSVAVDFTNALAAPVAVWCGLTNGALFTTVDGSAPTTNSPACTGPFSVANPNPAAPVSRVTIRALAVDRATGRSWEADAMTAVFHMPGRLDAARPAPSVCRLTLTGETNLHWLVQSSVTLTNWTPLVHLTNVTGSVLWDDTNAAGGAKFYRAVLE